MPKSDDVKFVFDDYGIFINGVWSGVSYNTVELCREALHEVFGDTPITEDDATIMEYDFASNVKIEIKPIG